MSAQTPPSTPPATWRALLLPPTGRAQLLTLPAPNPSYLPMLAEMGRLLHEPGHPNGVESVRLAYDLTAWVGEYSLLDGFGQNGPATYLMWHLRLLAGAPVESATTYPLCGPVIFTGGQDHEDESELPQRWVDHFAPALRR